jgi:uncharacterized protein
MRRLDKTVTRCRRASARLFLALSMMTASASAHAAAGPSFDCTRATSQVNQMICASPELSARDRRLAEHFRAMLGRPGVDGAALKREEAAWLRDVRDACQDAGCVAQAYGARDGELLERGRQAAGPAADDETQPFAVDPGVWTDARALRGSACAAGEDMPPSAGYGPVPGSLPVVSDGSVVRARRRFGADFAFLLDTRKGACRIVDVVALPRQSLAGDLLQCVVPAADGSRTRQSMGVGLRRPGRKTPVAYWEVDVAQGKLVRQPLGVSGGPRRVRCQEPGAGE